MTQFTYFYDKKNMGLDLGMFVSIYFCGVCEIWTREIEREIENEKKNVFMILPIDGPRSEMSYF